MTNKPGGILFWNNLYTLRKFFIRHQTGYLLKERLCNRLLVEVVGDVRVQKTSVPVVSHVTSVVDRCDEELECLPRRLIVLVQVQTQQVLRHLTVSTTFSSATDVSDNFWRLHDGQGANYKKILRLSYDVIITYDNRKSNLR